MKNIPFKFNIKDKTWIIPLNIWGEVRQICMDSHKDRTYSVLYYKNSEAKREWFDEENLSDKEEAKKIGYNL